MTIPSLFHFVLILWLTEALTVAASLAKSGCRDSCGGVKIPYPFGIGPDCYMNESFAVTCDQSSTGSLKPFLSSIRMELLAVSVTGQVRVNNTVISSNCRVNNTAPIRGVDLSGSPFVFSSVNNRFTAIGCDNYARLFQNGKIVGGCLSFCNKTERSNNGCYGLNCCQTTIPPNIKSFKAIMTSPFNSSSYSPIGCSISSFMVDQYWFENNQFESSTDVSEMSAMKNVPAVLEWGKDQGFCRITETSGTLCSSEYCWKEISQSHLCVCEAPYAEQGFSAYYIPYIYAGCEGRRCYNVLKQSCSLLCIYTPGSSNCSSCPDGYITYGDNRCSKPFEDYGTRSKVPAILIGCGSGLALLLLLIGMWWLLKMIKRRKEIELKQKFFKRNGGLLLQQQLSSGERNVDNTKLFTSKDLEKATDYYNAIRILGRGGQGTVYKGMLTDGKIVAVKKSKVVDEDKVEQFINEVVILSQINHRNVVKLLGCCLETEVPLLVYEFIPNGTLFQHLHGPNDEFAITWEIRLRIAAEVAGALWYLHSAASFPIYHRDIKSSNILLDEKYRAKVSDFGTSKSVAIDQTHVTTRVQGTFGYLDPEYFQSSQYTDKSDVYSFGVVLVELLTGQKPLSFARSIEGRSLTTYFLHSMEDNRLFEILDPRVLKEGRKEEEITAVARLAKRCLNLNGRKRPTMKTVAMELERIIVSQGPSNNTQQDYEEVDFAVSDIPGPWDTTSTSSGSRLNSSSVPRPLDVESQPLHSINKMTIRGANWFSRV